MASLDHDLFNGAIDFIAYAETFADFVVRAHQFRRLKVTVRGRETGLDQIIGFHVRQPPGSFRDRDVVNVKLDGFAHGDEVLDFLRALRRFGDAQRTGLYIDFHARALLEVFDDLHAIGQHARVFGRAAQLPKQPGGATA